MPCPPKAGQPTAGKKKPAAPKAAPAAAKKPASAASTQQEMTGLGNAKGKRELQDRAKALRLKINHAAQNMNPKQLRTWAKKVLGRGVDKYRNTEDLLRAVHDHLAKHVQVAQGKLNSRAGSKPKPKPVPVAPVAVSAKDHASSLTDEVDALYFNPKDITQEKVDALVPRLQLLSKDDLLDVAASSGLDGLEHKSSASVVREIVRRLLSRMGV